MKRILTKWITSEQLHPQIEDVHQNKHPVTDLLTFLLLIYGFVIAGCGGKFPHENVKVYTAEVGLTLKTGEACRYIYKDDNYNLNFLFCILSNGASFTEVNIKTLHATIISNYPVIGMGKSKTDDVLFEVNQNTAKMCIKIKHRSIQPGTYGYDIRKCFTAAKNPDGSWTVKNLPFSDSS